MNQIDIAPSEPEQKIRWYQFSLRTLLLFTALFAVCIGWWVDHTRLSRENAILNNEAAELLDKLTIHVPNAFFPMSYPDGKFPPQRSYDFQRPEDRAEYRRYFGHFMPPHYGMVKHVADID